MTHALGRGHLGFCMPQSSVLACSEEYPWTYEVPRFENTMWANSGFGPLLGPAGQLTDPEADLRDMVWGLDLHGPKVFDPASTFGYMSYCWPGSRLWQSKFTHERLIRPVTQGGQTYGDNLRRYLEAPHQRVVTDCVPSCSSEECEMAQPTLAYDDLTTVVTGIDGRFDRVFRVTEIATDRPDPDSADTTVRVEAEDGTTLDRTGAFEVESDDFTDQPGASSHSFFFAYVADNPAAHRIVVERDGMVIDERVASANPPTLIITAPTAGAEWSGDTGTLAWTAADADGDDLTYYLEYSADAGATWMTVSGNLGDGSYDVPLAGLPGGTTGRLRLVANDGFHSTVRELEVEIADHDPDAYAIFPEPGRTYSPTEVVMLRAMGADAEDGPLRPTDFAWRSDVDGDLGTGSVNVRASDLSAGTHTLTVAVTDSAGNVSEDTTTIEVLPPANPSGPDFIVSLQPVADVVAEQDVSLQLAVFNAGESAPTTPVELGFALPVGTTFVSSVGTDWNCAMAEDLRCTYVGAAAFDPANASDLEVLVRFPDRSETYTARVLAQVHTDEDREPTNDWDAREFRVVVPGRLPGGGGRADVEVTVSDPGELFPGDIANFYVAVRNIGTDAYPDPISVDLSWPPEFITQSHSGDGWSCSFGTLVASCTHESDSLDAGAALPTLTIEVQIDPGAGPPDVPLAGTSDSDDSNPDNDTATAATNLSRSLTQGPDLSVVSGGACSGVGDRRDGLDFFRFTCVPAFYLRDQGLTFGCAYIDGRLLASGCASDVRVQGGRWHYDVVVENVGTEPVTGPLTVVETLPVGLSHFPLRYNRPWNCNFVDQVATCDLADVDIPVGGFAPKLIFDVLIDDDAPPEVFNQVAISNAVDVNATNDTWMDPEPTRIRQINPPPPPPPADTDLRVDVVTTGPLTVDQAGTAQFTVRNGGSGTIATNGILLKAPTAPFLATLTSASGTGWICAERWGSAHCTFSGAPTFLNAGETLPALDVNFVTGPTPALRTEIAGLVSEPGSTEARGSTQVNVDQAARPDVGAIAISACPGFADCSPIIEPALTEQSNHLASLWLAQTDGRALTNLIPNDASWFEATGFTHADPKWTADGEALVYRRTRLNQTELIMVRPDSMVTVLPDGTMGRYSFIDSGLVEVTGARRDAIQGELSPDGSAILATERGHLAIGEGPHFRSFGRYSIGNPANFAFGNATDGYYHQPTWAPTSDRIAVVKRTDADGERIFVGDLTPSGRSWNYENEARLTTSVGRTERRPAWSPDGSEIAFSADGQIVVVAADGSNERILTTGGGPDDYDDHPSWSPDGSYIAFQRGEAPINYGTSYVTRHGPSRDTAIFMVEASGGTPVLVARGRHPSWRPSPQPAAVAGNTDPVAVDDEATTAFAQPIRIELVTNDSDADSDPVTIASTTEPSRGRLDCDDTGCTYTPGNRFVGFDQFQYTVEDGRGGTATANVDIEITSVSPGVRIHRPATNAEIPVPPGTTTVTGTASLGLVDDEVNVLFLVDLMSGIDPMKFEMSARLPAGSLPQSWVNRPSGTGGCLDFADDWAGDGINLAECAMTMLTRSAADRAVESGVITFIGDGNFGRSSDNPLFEPAVFDVDVDPATDDQFFVSVTADGNSNMRPDIEEVLHSINYGGCEFAEGTGPDIPDDTGANLFGTRPEVICRARGQHERARDGYDYVLDRMNQRFASQPPTQRNVAYLLSTDRRRVSEDLGLPLANAVAAGTVVHVLSEAARPRPPVDIVIAIDNGMTDKQTRIQDNMTALAASLVADTSLDWNVVLMAPTDYFASTPIGQRLPIHLHCRSDGSTATTF